MFGQFVPARLWEASPIRMLRRPAARLVGFSRSVRLHRQRWRALTGWRTRFSLAHQEGLLAPGGWRFLYFHSRKRGYWPQFLLVHESLDPRAALREVALVDPDNNRLLSVPFRRIRRSPGRTMDQDRIAAKVFMARHGAKSLGFDLEGRVVARISAEGFGSEWERVRGLFSARVPSVPFEVLQGRSAILEPSLTGVLMPVLPPSDQVDVALCLLESLAELTADARPGDSRSFLRTRAYASETAGPIGHLAEPIDSWLGEARCVPAHGDLHPANIMFDDGRATCFDFGAADWLPAWFDGSLLTLAVLNNSNTSGTPEEVERLTAGLERFLIRTTLQRGGGLPEDWRRLIAVTMHALTGPRTVSPALFEGPDAWAETG